MTKLLSEPCRPYDPDHIPFRNAPVSLSAIIDRLTEPELRGLVISLAIRRPAVFEQQLLGSWAERDAAVSRKP